MGLLAAIAGSLNQPTAAVGQPSAGSGEGGTDTISKSNPGVTTYAGIRALSTGDVDEIGAGQTSYTAASWDWVDKGDPAIGNLDMSLWETKYELIGGNDLAAAVSDYAAQSTWYDMNSGSTSTEFVARVRAIYTAHTGGTIASGTFDFYYREKANTSNQLIQRVILTADSVA